MPRPGYDRQPIRVGPTEVRIDLDMSALYDTNVYATSRDASDDVAIYAEPKVQIDLRGANTQIHGEAYAEARRFVDTTRENATSFGGALSAQLNPGKAHNLSTEIRYDRAIESRADPEARASILLRPRKIDIFAGEVNYGFRGSRIGLDLTGGVQKSDYLDPNEGDRDFTMFRGSARVTWRPAAPVALFTEAYINRRNFRTAVDVSGFNRDASTYGVLAGVSREISGRLTGRLGAGIFRFDPDDKQIASYSGLGFNGDITWTPRPRTMMTAQFFRGDVATARIGSTGRTDTRIAWNLQQEVRHNLLLYGRAGWTRTRYRGVGSDKLNTITVGAEVEYLISRRLSFFTGVDYSNRSSDDPLREFSRARFQAGVRTRF
nr:outer membrane beta-barrel protein [Sphingobium lactosutens]